MHGDPGTVWQSCPSEHPRCAVVLRQMHVLEAGGAAELLVDPGAAAQLCPRYQRRTDGDIRPDEQLRHPFHRCGACR